MVPICDTSCGPNVLPPAVLAALFVAGEVAFDGSLAPEVFAFTQVGPTASAIPLGTLNPDSNLFASPSPGVLEYIGTSPLRVRAGYGLEFTWTAATGGLTKQFFFSVLLLNGEAVGKTIQGTVLDIGADAYNVYSASNDTILTLQPGDTLQVGVGALTEETYTLSVSSLIAIANRV